MVPPDTVPMKLNVGCGRNILEGWDNLDSAELPGVNVVADLERPPFGLQENSYDEFLLSHVIEHIKSPLPLMEELWRVAKPGAKMEIRVPYGSSDDAWEDPTHVRPYFLDSWGYFSQPYYWRADYGYRGDWRVVQVRLHVPLRFNRPDIQTVISQQRNVVQEMVCDLEAVKPAREPKQDLLEPTKVGIVFG